MDAKPTPDKLQNLAAQWRVFAQLLVLYARRLVALKRAGAQNAAAEAEQLGLWAGAALAQINRQIVLMSSSEPEGESTEHLDHLKAIAICLLALLMFAQKLRADFIKLGRGLRSAGAGLAISPARLCTQDTGGGRAVVLLDPG